MSFNLRRRIRKSKTNGLVSYEFSINRNFRDVTKDMRPNHKCVAYIAYLQEHHFEVSSNQDKIWKKIKAETAKLLKDGTINELDAKKILDKAIGFLPKSTLPKSH